MRGAALPKLLERRQAVRRTGMAGAASSHGPVRRLVRIPVAYSALGKPGSSLRAGTNPRPKILPDRNIAGIANVGQALACGALQGGRAAAARAERGPDAGHRRGAGRSR